MNNITLKISRISPESNGEIDSVMATFENSTFKHIIEEWNTMSVDCFACYKSSKYSRIHSKYLDLSITFFISIG